MPRKSDLMSGIAQFLIFAVNFSLFPKPVPASITSKSSTVTWPELLIQLKPG